MVEAIKYGLSSSLIDNYNPVKRQPAFCLYFKEMLAPYLIHYWHPFLTFLPCCPKRCCYIYFVIWPTQLPSKKWLLLCVRKVSLKLYISWEKVNHKKVYHERCFVFKESKINVLWILDILCILYVFPMNYFRQSSLKLQNHADIIFIY